MSNEVTGTWLDVPIQEKDEAKRLGAHWSQRCKTWYIPKKHKKPHVFDRWSKEYSWYSKKWEIPTFDLELYGEVLKGTTTNGWDGWEEGNDCWSSKAIYRANSIYTGLVIWHKEPTTEDYFLRPDSFITHFYVNEYEGNYLRVVGVDAVWDPNDEKD